jgi:Fe-S-cluster containining protein
MLSKILSKEECASCKFCCSFRRKSLWESPLFPKENLIKLKELFPDFKVKTVSNSFFTFDISGNYKSQDPEEEALCPFLDSSKGCSLPEELKPMDCKIWPLRIVRHKNDSDKYSPALTPTCPSINKVPFSQLQTFVKDELEQVLMDYAGKHPDIIKDYDEFFKFI